MSENTPDLFLVIKYLSVFNYGYDLLMINQWEKVDSLICEHKNLTQLLCKEKGTDILKDLDISEVSIVNTHRSFNVPTIDRPPTVRLKFGR